jgi:hypothetical protein
MSYGRWVTVSGIKAMSETTVRAQIHPKQQADQNPWYLLATFHGEPTADEDALQLKNRITWNHFVARFLDEKSQARIVERGTHHPNELGRI